nr:hypothetical protein [Candidatus Sigynarchaeota archaeon]
MASIADDPESQSIIGVVSAHDRLNIYALSRILRWSYGRTERKVVDLIKTGKVFSRTHVNGGRNVKMLSIKPFPPEEIGKERDQKTPALIMLQDAFKHLYGIFLELKKIGINPRPALLSYCKDLNKDPNELMKSFDAANESLP